MKELADVLAQIAARPEASWPELVAQNFPGDAALRAQVLIWLRANREGVDDDEVTPTLAGDRYRLGVLLDVGATASVWQAHDAKLNRNVAVKVFRGERSPVLDEILTEARAAAEIASDHVVRVLDVHDQDTGGGGAPYIVMELVGEWEPRKGLLAPGSSAATLRPRGLAEAVHWVRDVARGVNDAHLRNVFHRDLKPHNVLITPFSRRARVADFGLAIREAQEPGALEIAGTPGYIAPEQAAGLSPTLDPHDPDDRAVLVALDVWGLGALAFDLVAGRPPWEADEGLEAWERAATADRSPELPRELPRRLRTILDKALALDPARRYATAGELADDLDAFLARRPTSHDTSGRARLALWTRRNPQLSITVGLAAVLAALSIVAYVNVVEVKNQRNALVAEANRARVENAQLAAHAQLTRENLAATEAELATKAKELEGLRTRLVDADKEYEAIVAAKERALRDADAATKQLADQLGSARAERDEARVARQLYEGFWTRARKEGEDAAQDRDAAQLDRDQAHKERDTALHDREAAIAQRDAAEQERDKALADRDHAESVRRRVEADLARVTTELAAMRPHPLHDQAKVQAQAKLATKGGAVLPPPSKPAPRATSSPAPASSVKPSSPPPPQTPPGKPAAPLPTKPPTKTTDSAAPPHQVPAKAANDSATPDSAETAP
ncbi:MAG: protein kinase [Kofleriaceae bacterium]